MKKGWKRLIIICSIVAVVGIVLVLIGIGMGATIEKVETYFPEGIGFHSETVVSVPASGDKIKAGSESEIRQFSGVRELDVSAEGGSLEIRISQGEDVRVDTSGMNNGWECRCVQRGGELSVETHKKSLVNIGNADYGMVVIYLPENFAGELEITHEAGMLYAEHLQAGSLSLDIGAGEGMIEYFSASEVDFDCGAGQITARGDFGSEMDVDCGVGEVSLTLFGEEDSYNYEVACGIGEVRVGQGKYSGVASEREIDYGARRELNIDCGVGSVSVDFEQDK